MKLLTIAVLLVLQLIPILACIPQSDDDCCRPKAIRCCCYHNGKHIVVRRVLETHGIALPMVDLDRSRMDCDGCEYGYKC
jgi:hypothetical protein